jgi:prophage maintenance system killer protein
VKEELEEIFNKQIDDIEKTIELLLYTMKKQIFIDGNKRTSVIYANHYLISKGKGIIVIPAELTEEFKKLLIPYYEGKDETKIKIFIKEKCYMSI